MCAPPVASFSVKDSSGFDLIKVSKTRFSGVFGPDLGIRGDDDGGGGGGDGTLPASPAPQPTCVGTKYLVRVL